MQDLRNQLDNASANPKDSACDGKQEIKTSKVMHQILQDKTDEDNIVVLFKNHGWGKVLA